MDIKELFAKAKGIYGQTSNRFYIADKDMNGLYLAVLPSLDDYVFTAYNFGDDDDVRKVNQIFQEKREIKTFGCSLCSIQEGDNAVLVSDVQNQFYIDPNTPSVQLQNVWYSSNGQEYIITATTPQYYYSHLLFLSATHIPTYDIFLIQPVFQDLFEYLTVINESVTAIFNGRSGSDIYHFHTHLTNQKFAVVENVKQQIESFAGDGLQQYADSFGIVNYYVLYSTDLNELYAGVASISYAYIQDPSSNLTANFFVHNVDGELVFCVILHMLIPRLIKKFGGGKEIIENKYTREIAGCDYTIIPAGYIFIANCFNVDRANYKNFVDAVNKEFGDVYLHWNEASVKELQVKYPPTRIHDEIINLPVADVITNVNYTVEQLGYTIMYFLYNNENPIVTTKQILSQLNCYLKECSPALMSKFLYILGMYVAFESPDDLEQMLESTDDVTVNTRIQATFRYMDTFSPNTDYLYFKGDFLAGMLRNSFDNLLLTTGADIPFIGNVISNQRIDINDWINYIFSQIGEASASGTVTTSKLRKHPGVDFIIKVMNPSASDNPELKYKEFEREFWASMNVNDIRKYVPNYIYCYGGFICKNDDFRKLCAGGTNTFTYLMLEHVKNAETVARIIKLPDIDKREIIIDRYTNMLFQVVIGLAFGWLTKQFTHYDLHLDNVMQYNFIENKGFLNLFKIYSESEGSKVPIVKAYFRYYYQVEGGAYNYFIVPAEYLYLIIDYGNSYLDGVPNSVQHVDENLKDTYGMMPNQPKSVADVYTFSMSLLYHISVYKPYLIFGAGGWLNNRLTAYFRKFLESYSALFTDVNQFWNNLPILSNQQSHQRRGIIGRAMLNALNYKHNDYFHYVPANFTADNVAPDFSTPVDVAVWIQSTLYDTDIMVGDLGRDDVYVFNWGFLPPGKLAGVEKNAYIQELLDNKNAKNSDVIASVKDFEGQQ